MILIHSADACMCVQKIRSESSLSSVSAQVMRIHSTTITRLYNLNCLPFTKQKLRKGNTGLITPTPLSYRDTLPVSRSDNQDSIFQLNLEQCRGRDALIVGVKGLMQSKCSHNITSFSSFVGKSQN